MICFHFDVGFRIKKKQIGKWPPIDQFNELCPDFIVAVTKVTTPEAQRIEQIYLLPLTFAFVIYFKGEKKK